MPNFCVNLNVLKFSFLQFFKFGRRFNYSNGNSSQILVKCKQNQANTQLLKSAGRAIVKLSPEKLEQSVIGFYTALSTR